MSSGFVPAGSAPQNEDKTDEWTRVKQQVEAAKSTKPSAVGQQEGGKSLYEHLQANKAAKQEAFEEAAKLRNQFRALDDSEVQFLESIREKERSEEAAARQADAEQLAVFRKERAATDRLATAAVQENEDAVTSQNSKSVWSAAKRKRRAPEAEKGTENKAKKLSTEEHQVPSSTRQDSAKDSSPLRVVDDIPEHAEGKATNTSEISRPTETKPVPALPGMGLDVYGSDDEED